MQVQQFDTYLRVTPEKDDTWDPNLFLGWHHRKHEAWYTVEDNLVNRIVLGQDVLKGYTDSGFNILDREELLDYQIKDVDRMSYLRHCLNANPMGLGKTIETIEYLASKNVGTALIVTPKIIREQWVDKINTWWGACASIYDRQKRITPGIWIVNYDKLRNENTLIKFRSFQWDVLVLDEAHRIKNRKSKQAMAVKQIPSKHRIALTGTPILRYVDDLWSILHFLDWRFSGRSYHNFVSYFCHLEQTPWGTRILGLSEDPTKIAILNKLLSLICIRNNAIEVAHGKTSEVVNLSMSKEQKELYDKEKNLLLDELPEDCTIANGAVLTLRLRQTTTWPGLFLPTDSSSFFGPKFEWVLETCKDHLEEKFVVFSCFEQAITALQEYLTNNGVRCVTITGKNNEKTNSINKQIFLKQNCQVLAGTIGAMGQGYDELQYVCRLVIFLDRDWSPEIVAQAEDRLHRMGQKYPVHVYYLECKNSFDKYVGKINQNKSNDIREALTYE